MAKKVSKTPATRPQPVEPRPKAADAEHEGGTERQIGDRTGPGAGYDEEPEQVKDQGGVS